MSLFHALGTRRGRVLFVCLGNSCRSQVAEAFARVHGADVIDAASAGLQPASRISRRTRAAMDDKKTPILDDQAPKNIAAFDLESFDLIVNLSEYALPKTETQVLKYRVLDPMGHPQKLHREICDRIEGLVRFLAEHFRSAREWSATNPLYSEECAEAPSFR
jgi:arsenate reductase